MSEVTDEDMMQKVEEEDAEIDGEGDEEDDEDTKNAKEGKPLQAKETVNL